jgi:hypothetical protein
MARITHKNESCRSRWSAHLKHVVIQSLYYSDHLLFYPLWRDHDHGQVMARFFSLLAEHFPKDGDRYARGMNWGEFVHFMSGAAGVDLQPQAEQAFGWPSDWQTQLDRARADFPGTRY